MNQSQSQNYINHVVLVLDASSSMFRHSRDLIKVADSQITYLAQRSKELDQETRVSIYTFADRVQCLVYDKDVLRLPSIAKLYGTNGMTALVDATIKSLDDLDKTATLYGDHAFLTFVLTDGQENASRQYTPATLKSRLNTLPDNWTVAVLVPDSRGVFEAKSFGFAPDNIAVWNPEDSGAITEVGNTIRAATETFMVNRSLGIRSTRGLFSTGVEAINHNTVRAAALKPLTTKDYLLLPVRQVQEIRPFVEMHGVTYRTGRAFYQLSKTEHIQPTKEIALQDKKTNQVFTGRQARDLLGLPDTTVKVKPDYNPLYDVFVQSTSVNRKLMPNTNLLVLK